MPLLMAPVLSGMLLAALPIDFGPARDATLRVTGLLATQADYWIDPPGGVQPGFSVSDARLGLLGTLPDDLEFFVQANLILQPALLDLRLTWQPDPRLVVDTGFIKVPFSVEFILNAADLEFTDRSQAVIALAPNRQVGAQVRGVAQGKRLQYAVGVFNGNRGIAGNEDDGVMIAGRVASEIPLSKGRFEIGVNGAVSEDKAFTNTLVSSFAGRRILAGADTRLEVGPWFATAELIWSRFDADAGPTVDPYGYQASTGWAFTPVWAAKARYDHLDPGAFGPISDLLILGAGPTWAVFSIWLDAVIPLADAAGSQRFLLTTQAYW